MKRQVLIRGVDDETYRQAKAAEALLGLPMGTAVGIALREWVARAERNSSEKELAENLAFVKREWERIKGHRGKFAVVASGRLQGIFDSEEEARGFSSRFRMALTFAVEGKPQRHDIEFGPEMAVQQWVRARRAGPEARPLGTSISPREGRVHGRDA